MRFSSTLTAFGLSFLSQDALASSLSAKSAIDMPGPKRRTVKDVEETNMAPETRIIGGSLAPSGQFPWFAASTGNYFCGASLIHKDILLTAAHCADVFRVGSGVYVGANSRDSSSGGAHYRTIVSMKRHEDYDDTTIQNDYLLLKLSSAVPNTPVRLNAQDSFPPSGEVLTTMGFGLTSEGGSVSYSLREVDLVAIDHNVCAAQYKGVLGLDNATPLTIPEDIMMCAGVRGGGKSSCNGDSGGPLVTASGVQVGIVSFGVGCAQENFSGVYARVSGVIEWINESVCDMSDDPPEECSSEGPALLPTPGTAGIRVHFGYDYWVKETLWTLSQGDNILFYGPDYEPGPYQVWNTSFVEVPAGYYTFTVYDSACDGLASSLGNGFFKILLIDGEKEILLAGGDHLFGCSESVDFVVPGTVASYLASECKDGEGTIVDVSDSESKTCNWLADNMDTYDYLCDWQEVSFACPVTCGSCTTIRELPCEDQLGTVQMDATIGEQDCIWLSNNMERYGFVCDRTELAFHCPVTCGTGECWV
jgi:hypothetical protein